MRYLMILVVLSACGGNERDPSDPTNWYGDYALEWTSSNAAACDPDQRWLPTLMPVILKITPSPDSYVCSAPMSCRIADGVGILFDRSGFHLDATMIIGVVADTTATMLTDDGFRVDLPMAFYADGSAEYCLVDYRLTATRF